MGSFKCQFCITVETVEIIKCVFEFTIRFENDDLNNAEVIHGSWSFSSRSLSVSLAQNTVAIWNWALRKLTASAIFCTLSWTAYHHQDLSRMNIAVMQQIHQDNEEIRRLLVQMRGKSLVLDF